MTDPQAATPPRTIEERLGLLERDIANGAVVIGSPGLAARPAWRDRAGAPVTLVVAGETSRGKTSLVNSLVGVPRLLPVGADVTTNVYVVIRAGQPRGLVRLEGGAAFDVTLDDLPRWITVNGRRSGDPQAVMVEVETPSALLERGLAIIDTPGVGGLDSAHAASTMLALEQADALLFVLDASAPISAPERAFLESASNAIDTVIFAVTKTDLYPGWETVRAQTQQFIALHLPRFARAPVLPLSNELVVQANAAEAINPAFAASVRAKAGVDAVTDAIERLVLTPGARLRQANRLRAAESAIERLRAHVEATRSAASGDAGAAEAVSAARTRIAENQGSAGMWRPRLADDVALLRGEINRTFTHQMIQIEDDLGQLTDPIQLETYPAALEERLAGTLISLNATLARGLGRIAETLAATLEIDGIALEAPQLPTSIARPAASSTYALPEKTTEEQVVGVGRLVLSSLGPVTFGSYVIGSAFLPVLLPLGLAVGLTMGIVERRATSQKTSLMAAQRQWSEIYRRTVNPMKVDIVGELDERMTAARQRLTSLADEAIRRRDVELTAEYRRLVDVARRTQEDRAALEQTAVNHLHGLEVLATRAAALRREITLAVGAAALATPSPVALAPAAPAVSGPAADPA